MLMGQAYTNVLTPQEQQALQASCDILIDSLFDDIQNVKKTEDVAHTMLGIYLPERYLYTYTPRFLRKFAVCINTVAWKLSTTKTHNTFLPRRRFSGMDHYPGGNQTA